MLNSRVCVKDGYSDFTLAKVKEIFDLTLSEDRNLFLNVEPVQPSDYLTQALSE